MLGQLQELKGEYEKKRNEAIKLGKHVGENEWEKVNIEFMRDNGTFFVTREMVDRMIDEIMKKFIKDNNLENYVEEYENDRKRDKR